MSCWYLQRNFSESSWLL